MATASFAASVFPTAADSGARTTTALIVSAQPRDHRRAWIWWFLGVLVASQLYFVREMLAAFALFTLAFAAVAAVVVTLYMLQKSAQLAIARFSALRQPAISMAAAIPSMTPARSQDRKAA